MPINTLAPFLLTVIAGAMVAAQPAFNGQLSGHLGSPLRAALVSFTAGALIMLAAVSMLAYRAGWPSLERISNTPPHLFVIGGALGGGVCDHGLLGGAEDRHGIVLCASIRRPADRGHGD
jgi:transporter family-2 protein